MDAKMIETISFFCKLVCLRKLWEWLHKLVLQHNVCTFPKTESMVLSLHTDEHDLPIVFPTMAEVTVFYKL